MKLDAIKHPVLVEEARYEVMAEELNDPQKIVNMFNDSVQLSDKAEEYLYMIALDSKCNALGIFEACPWHCYAVHYGNSGNFTKSLDKWSSVYGSTTQSSKRKPYPI